jgi:hypothetical protein
MEVTEKRPKPNESRAANHVRVTGGGKLRNYCGYVTRSVVLRADNDAMGKCISVAEWVKRNVEGLHQITTGAFPSSHWSVS